MIKKVFPILALCMFSSTLGIGVVAPLLPLYLRQIGATDAWLGIAIGAYSISNSLAVPIAGRLSDRTSRRIFLVFGFLSYAIISLGYLWADSVAAITALRFGQGMAEAATIPIALAYLGDLSPEGEEGKWMGLANALFFAGFGLGPFIGGLMTEHFGIVSTFLATSVLNMVSFLIAILFLPKVETKKSMEGAIVSLRTILSNSNIRGLFACRVGQALGMAALATFLPITASSIGLNTSQIGLVLSANIFAMNVFAPFVGIIADKFNRRVITIAGGLLMAVTIISLPFAFSLTILLFLLLIRGLIMAVYEAAFSAISFNEGRTLGMGATVSTLFFGFSFGMAIGPVIAGGIAGYLGGNYPFYFGAIMGIAGTALFAWFTRKANNLSRAKPAALPKLS